MSLRQHHAQKLRDLAVAFALAIVDLVDETSASENETYSTSGPRAPGVSKRTHNAECRSGKVTARKEGREWICTREAWHRARAKRTTPSLRLVEAPQTDAELASAMIAAAGYRSVR